MGKIQIMSLLIIQELQNLSLDKINKMRIISSIIVLLILLGCMDIHKGKNSKMQINALSFLISKNYKYSTSKSDIPNIVLDSISIINKESFKIGDKTDIEKISLSDTRLFKSNGEDIYEYKKKLHFVLVNDTICLIAYTEGGLGIHDVIDFIQYRGEFNHERYVTTNVLNDTIKLASYLKNLPVPSSSKSSSE